MNHQLSCKRGYHIASPLAKNAPVNGSLSCGSGNGFCRCICCAACCAAGTLRPCRKAARWRASGLAPGNTWGDGYGQNMEYHEYPILSIYVRWLGRYPTIFLEYVMISRFICNGLHQKWWSIMSILCPTNQLKWGPNHQKSGGFPWEKMGHITNDMIVSTLDE